MLSAGLLAKKAVEAGLSVAKFVRRSLCPGSGIVTAYLQESGVMPYLHMLGFEVMGYGCSACVENSRKPALAAETDRPLMEAIRYTHPLIYIRSQKSVDSESFLLQIGISG